MFPVIINTVIMLRFFLPKHPLMQTCTDTALGIKKMVEILGSIYNNNNNNNTSFNTEYYGNETI